MRLQSRSGLPSRLFHLSALHPDLLFCYQPTWPPVDQVGFRFPDLAPHNIAVIGVIEYALTAHLFIGARYAV